MLKMTNWIRIGALCGLVAALAAPSSSANALSLTADLDSDFPAQYIREGSSLSPSDVVVTDPPLARTRTDGTPIIISGATVPSGFHTQRAGAYYDCRSDTLYIGLDVSNPTTDPAGRRINSYGIPVPSGDPTAVVSRAWDVDGDGNPCGVANPMLVSRWISGLSNPNDDVPNRALETLAESYFVMMDFDSDGIADATLQVYDDGQDADDRTCSTYGLPTHKHFANPCLQNPTVHASLASWTGSNFIINPANNPSIIVEVKYAVSTDPDYATHRDIEFSIKGVHNISLSAGPMANSNPYHIINLQTLADSSFDSSSSPIVNWGEFNFMAAANLLIQCQLAVDKPKLCKLPDTTTCTLTAKNNSATSTADITITDADFAGSPWVFKNVPAGQSRTVGDGLDQAGTVIPPAKTFDATFCGSAPFVTAMYLDAVPVDCGVTGNVSASCQTTVAPPDTALVSVAGSQTVDKPQMFSLADSATFTLSATNSSLSNTFVTITISDSSLAGSPWVFTNVARGASRYVGDGLDQAHTVQKPIKLFDTSFLGSAPFVNTMTIVAAAEGCSCGIQSASASANSTIIFPGWGNPKAQPDGAYVTLSGGIVTMTFLDGFYIESSSRNYGIEIVKPGHGTAPGDAILSIAGIIRTNSNGERYIDALSVTPNGRGLVGALGLRNRDVGGDDWCWNSSNGVGQCGLFGATGMNNIGMLITTWGRTTETGRDWFYIDDGSNVKDGTGNTGIYVRAPGLGIPAKGSYVSVTGISSCENYAGKTVSMLMPRWQNDIVVIEPGQTGVSSLIIGTPADPRGRE